jgi:multiple antibiotic resistance protein
VIDSLWSYTLLATGSLLAVLNPFATVPPFIAMTAGNTVAERKAMAGRASLIAFAILTVFALSGLRVLNFFGVSAAAFQIAGGLVLVRVAFDLLQGGASLKVTAEERVEGALKDDISVTPLAVPLLCGPATIATAMLVSSQATTYWHMVILVLSIACIYGAILGLLRVVSVHSHRLGDTPVRISSRLMGLILVAVAVQFILEGMRQAGFA